MTAFAWCFRRGYSATLGDLDGATRKTGLISFGETTGKACPCPMSPQEITKATGWRPLLASFSYTATSAATASPANVPTPGTPHGVALYFTEQIADTIQPPLSLVGNARWAERWFVEPAVHTVYASGVYVPVSEETGHPWDLRIVTTDRGESTDVLVTVDWGWERQGGTNIDRAQLDALIEELRQARGANQ